MTWNMFSYSFLVQSNPCTRVDGLQPLAISEKGFIMGNGELIFVEWWPDDRVWENPNKACIWPDMQDIVGTQFAD
jgi:hypothetical protein